jgi:hypothetical protein
MHILNFWLVGAVLMWALAFNLNAQDDSFQADSESPAAALNRHRIDLSAIYFASDEFDSLIGLFGYAYNITSKSNIAVEVAYLDSNFGRDGGSGIGDSSITYSYEPRVGLSVHPWVPKKVGSGISLVLPTGNTKDSRSLDAVLVNPFIGSVFFLADNFSLQPLLSYSHSMDPIINGKDVRLLTAEVGIVWMGKKELWVAFYPSYVRDFEVNESHVNFSLSVGKMISSKWGGSVEYSDLEHFQPGVIPGREELFDQSFKLSIHFLF